MFSLARPILGLNDLRLNCAGLRAHGRANFLDMRLPDGPHDDLGDTPGELCICGTSLPNLGATSPEVRIIPSW